MRLIDADGLKESLLDKSFFPAIVKGAIERAPTIDAVPVKHGRWVMTPVLKTDPDGDWVALEYHCSLCNRLEYRKENYCPNCGAKMDLEE